MVLNWENFVLNWGMFGKVWRHFGYHSCGVLLGLWGERPRMLINTLPCTGEPPLLKAMHGVSSAEVETLIGTISHVQTEGEFLKTESSFLIKNKIRDIV